MLYKLNSFFQDKSESINETGKDKVDSPPAPVENLEEKKAAAANFIGQKLNASSEFQKFKHQGLDVSKDVEIEQVVNTAEAGLTEALKEASPAQSQQSNLDEDTTEDITMLDYSKQSSFVTDFDSMTPDVVQVFDPEEDHHDLIGRSTALEKPHVCGKFCNPSLTKYVDTISLMIFLIFSMTDTFPVSFVFKTFLTNSKRFHFELKYFLRLKMEDFDLISDQHIIIQEDKSILTTEMSVPKQKDSSPESGADKEASKS